MHTPPLYMRKIKISTIYPTSTNGYEIPLGNGAVLRFTSLKQANNFLNGLNQFLTEQGFYITNLYCQIYTKCRAEFWHTNTYEQSRKLNSELDIANETIINAYDKAPYKVGHHLVFINLNKALRALTRVLCLLREIDKGRSNTVNTYQFKAWQTEIEGITAQLSSYAKDTAIDMLESIEGTIGAYKTRPTVYELKVVHKKAV